MTAHSVSWTKPARLELGERRIDDEHDQIERALSALIDATDSDFAAALARVGDSLQHHFEHENALMAGQDFSTRECHIDEHAAVLASIAEVSALLAAGRLDVGRRLAARLVEWFPAHVEALDLGLAKFLFKERTGGAALLIRRQP